MNNRVLKNLMAIVDEYEFVKFSEDYTYFVEIILVWFIYSQLFVSTKRSVTEK